MAVISPFLIYDASAGSGKTYTLVKEYLKILFRSKSKLPFKNILAITFTNKAAGEMKSRIVDSLIKCSQYSKDSENNSMFEQLCNELNYTELQLQEKSKQILSAIIHNYAAFDISTIDGFTHKLIRTFAFDLKIPLNFEVELDTNSLLIEAVDRLVSKAGTNKELTKILVEYAIEKADDDKSWDISRDLFNISKLLINEKDIPYLESFQDKSISDFKALKKHVLSDLVMVEKSVQEKAQEALTLIDESGLEHNDFNRKSLPNYFLNLNELKLQVRFNSAWQEDLVNGGKIYPSRVTNHISEIIEAIQESLAKIFNETKQLVYQHKFLGALYKNITPLSVLNEIQKELQEIKKEQNVILISEFNALISAEIKDQPTPFIYERFGERFKHYFIDEFQDTSVLQWENLIPLINNALSSENGSLMMVGDAKQAIYRWRGGKAEQFIDLFNKANNPFFIEPNVISLSSNFRSHQNIIEFNNGFFDYLANTLFNNQIHKDLYKKSAQYSEIPENGLVKLTFLDIDKAADSNLFYSKKVHENIVNVLDQGYELKDICVLVRKKKEGVTIAEYLSECGIPIMSSETLLLKNSLHVQFIINMLSFLSQPNNLEIKAQLLKNLIQIKNIDNSHEFMNSHVHLKIDALFQAFEKLNVFLNNSELQQLTLYDIVETIIRSFKLVKDSDAYIQYFMDIVLEFSNKQKADIFTFVKYFEAQSDKLSIVSPEGFNAVKIMTIHKSKGLEFPVVIFPFAELNIYKEISPTEWFPINPELYQGFSHALLNYNSAFENFGEAGLEIYNRHQSELELDNINLLYVALTRPVEQLYIISKKDISSKGLVNNKTFAGFFIQYLQTKNLWLDDNLEYTFGQERQKTKQKLKAQDIIEQNIFVSTNRKDNNIKIITNSGYLWDTEQKNAIEKGNIIHEIMALIKSRNDLEFALSEYSNTYVVDEQQDLELKKNIQQIVNHPDLIPYFNSENKIFNECDIVAPNGNILRPDKVVVSPNLETTIIDYKSGREDIKHQAQLSNYEDTLKKMNFNVVKKILVYINDDIQIKEF